MEKTLYRYRSFNTERIKDYSFIHKKEIDIEKWKFEAFEGLVEPSSPLYFNDPYDCEFCFQSDIIEDILDRETCLQILENRFRLKREERDRIRYSDSIEKAVETIVQAHGGRMSDSWWNDLESELDKCTGKIKDAVRVVCLSEVYDSMLMWSHYAQNHKGYCIEYRFTKEDMFYQHLHQVEYTKDRYVISKADFANENAECAFKTACRKAEVWSYEREWRIVMVNVNKVMPQKLEFPNGKYVLDLKDNIKAFYLGVKISDEFKTEMVRFGKENNIDVYQMLLSSNTYELNAEKIV